MMAGIYTEIVGIIAPSETTSGAKVSLEVKVKNIWDKSFYVAVTGRYDGVDIAFKPDYANVGAGVTYSFANSFTMPNKAVKVDVWSFYWTGTEWYQDDYRHVDISLAGALVEHWHEIGTAIRRVISVKIVPPEVEVPYWHEIGSPVSISVVVLLPIEEVEHWHEIGTAIRRVISVAPPVEVPYWHEIGTAIRRVISVKITPPEIPPEEEVEKEIPWGPIALVGGGLALVAAAFAKPKATERKR